MIFFFRHSYILILLLLAISCASIDESSPKPEDNFIKFYGDINEHSASQLLVKDDGELVLFGTKTNSDRPQNGSDFYFIRVAPDGNMISDKTLAYVQDSIETEYTDQIPGKIKAVDGGYLIIGTVSELNEALEAEEQRLYAARLDDDFNIIQELEISATDIGANVAAGTDVNVGGTDIIQLDDGSVIFVGYSDVSEGGEVNGNSIKRSVLVGHYSMDADGVEKIWRKTLGSSNSNDEAIFVGLTEGNQYMVIGHSDNIVGSKGATGTNVAFWILNSLGNISSGAPVYGISGVDRLSGNTTAINTYDDIPSSVYEDVAGGFTVVGTSTIGANSYPFLLKVNALGGNNSGFFKLLYPDLKVEGMVNSNARGFGVTRARDANYIVVGQIDDFSEVSEITGETTFLGNQMMFLKSDQGGVALSGLTSQFGIQNGDDLAIDVKQTADGKIVMLGTADFGGDTKLFSLIKLNNAGEIAR